MTDLTNYSSMVHIHEPIHEDYPNLRTLILTLANFKEESQEARQLLVDSWLQIYDLDKHCLFRLESLSEFLLSRVGVAGT